MGGYNPPTTDAWDLIKRRQAQDRLATREALRVGGTQPFQVTRKTSQSIVRLDEQAGELADIVAQLQQTVAAIPITQMGQQTTGGWGPSGGWATVAAISLLVPSGKTKYTAHAVGAVDAEFSGSDGFPQGHVRVLINGQAGMDMGARGTYYDGGSGLSGSASGVAQHMRSQSGVGGSISAEVQFYISWLPGGGTSAAWGCQAQIALNATFTA